MGLVIIIMGQDCEKFLPMCLKSVKDADNIVYIDGGSTDKSKEIAREYGEVIYNRYDQLSKKANGQQRNIYLNYVKEQYPDDWCLALDADEVVEDLDKIKEFIQISPPGLYNVRMRHLIQDLAHEDSNQEIHMVLKRLFKISEADYYDEVEHPVLIGKFTKREQIETVSEKEHVWMDFHIKDKEGEYSTNGSFIGTTIWHLSHINEMFSVKRKYENHSAKSNMHTPEFLKDWYYRHLFGTYPTKKFNPVELPDVILNEFGVNKDELYFANRGLELKHFIDATHWRDFFKCETAMEVGCGRGPRVFAMRSIGIKSSGFDISKYAIENSITNQLPNETPAFGGYTSLGDITVQGISLDSSHEEAKKEYIEKGTTAYNKTDLVIAYDVLEHIEYDKLDLAINNLIELTKKNILISVPVIGDPNLLNDPTHKIKETKEWWIKQFTDKGIKLIKTPDHFLFKHQIIIFEK